MVWEVAERGREGDEDLSDTFRPGVTLDSAPKNGEHDSRDDGKLGEQRARTRVSASVAFFF